MKLILPYRQIDAFTKEPFRGNPAVVFILDQPLEKMIMQKIAFEMNQPETAFVIINANNSSTPLIRWFTPNYEIDLCGHATLASAYVLFNERYSAFKNLKFSTLQSGDLYVNREENGALSMILPSRVGTPLIMEDVPSFVLKGLSRQFLPLVALKSRDLMLLYAHETQIREMNPDFNILKDYKSEIIVTAPSSSANYDFVSRFFAANDAIKEDPVTGSAHCTLGPYWAKKLNKIKLNAYQASERTGELSIEILSSQIKITGNCIEILKGEITL